MIADYKIVVGSIDDEEAIALLLRRLLELEVGEA